MQKLGLNKTGTSVFSIAMAVVVALLLSSPAFAQFNKSTFAGFLDNGTVSLVVTMVFAFVGLIEGWDAVKEIAGGSNIGKNVAKIGFYLTCVFFWKTIAQALINGVS